MAEPPLSAAPPRGERRRVGALLNAYYRIEGGDGSGAPGSKAGTVESDLDRQGFDAKRYFDSMVSSGKLADLEKQANELNVEVGELDADMQKLVYENYSKFIRATDVIKQMKFTIEGLEPDLTCLQGSLDRITEHQRCVEDGVSGRAEQIETLLTRQKNCRKLQVLFGLPATLQRCLDQAAYGKAVEAYCCCAVFLRQYQHMPTFHKVLEEVEVQMGRIRNVVENRLRSPELSVDEAVNSSVTLLDLGEDFAKVAKDYLSGRAAVLQRSLELCFPADNLKKTEEAMAAEASSAGKEAFVELSKEQKDLQRPESVILACSCNMATESYVPHLCDAVEGFQKLQESQTGGSVDEGTLSTFVSTWVEEFCERLSALLEQKYPPTRVVVSCIHSVRDSLRRLHSLQPRLLTKLFTAFLNRTATNAMKALFSVAAASLVADLCSLHAGCKQLQESKNSGLDDVLEEIAKTEQSLIMHGFTALCDSQPLLNLLGSDRPACQQLVRGLHGQLITLFLAFAEACHTYVRHEQVEVQSLDAALPSMPRVAVAELEDVVGLDWNGLFALALVRIGRHLEKLAISKVWAVAKDLFSSGADSSELVANAAVIRAARGGAQAVMTHYAVMSGQRLASFFRNSVQARNWMTVREPRDPRVVVEMVSKEVHAFDAQLARILGDPRKPCADHQRRTLNRYKNSMDSETERLWARGQQVFAPIPFNRNGAIVGILRIAFKALYEYMREETFAKFGLQQIQVDCAFLAEVVRDFVEAEDASVLDSLLDEVVTSAKQRCDDPVLMDPASVEMLCDSKKKKGFKLDS